MTMTIQSQVSVQAEVSKFRPHDYQVFAGLDVDKHSIAVTFCNHEELLQRIKLGKRPSALRSNDLFGAPLPRNHDAAFISVCCSLVSLTCVWRSTATFLYAA